MLDRYTITLQPDALTLVLGVEVPEAYTPHFNAAPTKKLPVITSADPGRVAMFHWGLMTPWSNNKAMSPKFFNLPFDSVKNKPTYRKKLISNRCIIPMDGFYLWKQVSKKQQVPYYFTFPDKRVFSVAGLWEENEEGAPSFIMIMRDANEQIREFQEDMPTIVTPASARKWLESDNQEELISLLDIERIEEFTNHTVGPKIRELDRNDVSLIAPAPPADQHGNYTLFT